MPCLCWKSLEKRIEESEALYAGMGPYISLISSGRNTVVS